MKLLILGATGGTGLETVRQAIERGHRVSTFVRSPDKLAEFGGRATVMCGDLMNSGELARAMLGQDAVISSFGRRDPKSGAQGNLLRNFAVVVADAMGQAKIRRLIVVSMAFLFRDAIIPPAYLFGRLFFGNLVEDANRMEEVIQNSGLDWTIVRPPRLNNKRRTGRYRVREGHLPRFGFKISRADVADYTIRIAEDGSAFGKIEGISD
jgi:putative NADH-flavin reductase